MNRYKFLIPLICFTLISSKCEDISDHHDFVTIINNSDFDIYLCTKVTHWDGSYTVDDAKDIKYNLNRVGTLEKNSSIEWQPFHYSIERYIGGGQILEFYLVNPSHYNENLIFYDCDSIPIKNDVLAYYSLTIEDLQVMNFKVSFHSQKQIKIKEIH